MFICQLSLIKCFDVFSLLLKHKWNIFFSIGRLYNAKVIGLKIWQCCNCPSCKERYTKSWFHLQGSTPPYPSSNVSCEDTCTLQLPNPQNRFSLRMLRTVIIVTWYGGGEENDDAPPDDGGDDMSQDDTECWLRGLDSMVTWFLTPASWRSQDDMDRDIPPGRPEPYPDSCLDLLLPC